MILNAIINLLASFTQFLLNPIGTIDSSFISYLPFYNTLKPFFSVVTYFFPMDYVSPILSLVIGIITYKIVVSFVRTLWSLFPFTG